MSGVRNNRGEHRYEIEAGGDIAYAAYAVSGDTIIFTHTIVPSALEGHGIASRLIAGALADVRARGLNVIAQCSFVAAYIERHPDTQDLRA